MKILNAGRIPAALAAAATFVSAASAQGDGAPNAQQEQIAAQGQFIMCEDSENQCLADRDYWNANDDYYSYACEFYSACQGRGGVNALFAYPK